MQVVASVAEIMFEDEDGRLRQISSLDSAAVAGVCSRSHCIIINAVFLGLTSCACRSLLYRFRPRLHKISPF